jgi:formate dehydrogenase iron-sulfur subunit
MKFLCDADRCIECNACVTACKNEHEVPWGINRRRVVTINDGKPGERSISMACMHCTDAPCAAVCPVDCFYTTADGVVLHSKDLCIGCGYCFYACPFGAPQYPRSATSARAARWTSAPSAPAARKPTTPPPSTSKYGSNRLAEGKLPLCAEMCSTKSLLAGDGDIIAQIYKERVPSAATAPAPGAGRPPTRKRSRLIDGRRHAAENPPRVRFRRMFGMKGRLAWRNFRACPLYRRCAHASDCARARRAGSARNSRHRSIRPPAAVKEEQLFQQLQRLDGRVSIPDPRAGVLIQPAGQDWRTSISRRCTGSAASRSSACFLLLIVFYAVRGTVKIEAGRSGRTIVRFNGFERFTHWLTATTFIILALSGLNITFGKSLLLPLIWAGSLRDDVAMGQVLPQLPELPLHARPRADLPHLDQGQHPGRVDVNGSSAAAASSATTIRRAALQCRPEDHLLARRPRRRGDRDLRLLLMFPFYGTASGMQLAAIIHGVVSVLLIAVMLAHIYIGTLGMEGAFEAMGSGEVDLNWAKEHHSLWVVEDVGAGTGEHAGDDDRSDESAHGDWPPGRYDTDGLCAAMVACQRSRVRARVPSFRRIGFPRAVAAALPWTPPISAAGGG